MYKVASKEEQSSRTKGLDPFLHSSHDYNETVNKTVMDLLCSWHSSSSSSSSSAYTSLPAFCLLADAVQVIVTRRWLNEQAMEADFIRSWPPPLHHSSSSSSSCIITLLSEQTRWYLRERIKVGGFYLTIRVALRIAFCRSLPDR